MCIRDSSYGASMARRGDEMLRRHYFGSLDTGRMVANSAFEAPFDPPMTGFRSDPYDNQSGEMEADGVANPLQLQLQQRNTQKTRFGRYIAVSYKKRFGNEST